MKHLQIDLSPEQYSTPELLTQAVARQLGVRADDLQRIAITRRSLDSRRGRLTFHTELDAFLAGESIVEADYRGHYKDCRNAKPVIIVGAGPAGLFAALKALELDLRPIILDRGKDVSKRKYDIARLAKEQVVNPDSNWCFGEGGAGTYSDGKLYTRSTKRGNIQEILYRFVEHGADPSILIDAHAHIGTDRLSGIIANIRRTIEEHGGEYHFDTRVTDFITRQDGDQLQVSGATDAEGNRYEGCAVVLATGHSARDIYELFHLRGWLLEAKPFALGVRVEHPQSLINNIQYHAEQPQCRQQMPFLPPAAYSLTTQVDGHGVFSFCMCPGGIIVPAATAPGQQVVNGMSNSKRNSPFANSGIAVTIGLDDVPQYAQHGSLALLRFQEEVERNVFAAAGNAIAAPTQRLTDFCQGRPSRSIGATNYMGQTLMAPLHEILPATVTRCLQQGFKDFDRKMRGFYTSEAHLLAVESRTSSPVRIPRGKDMQHPQLRGLYPCGEGAGYAGGIVSSAIDGTNAILCLTEQR